MKKCFKTIAIILCLFLIIEICFPTLNSVKAVIEGNTDTMLIASGVTIKDTTTLKEVISQYGQEPKIVTTSVFGGTANTFYKTGYEDLLYVETDENGVVMSAGSCAKEFKSRLSNHGDPFNGTVRSMQGYTIDDWDDGAIGVLVYNTSAKTYANIKNTFDKWYNNQYEYEKNLCKHTIPIVNCYLTRDGDDTIEFNNDIYDTLAKIEQNGKDIETYAKENDKTDLYKRVRMDTGYLATYECFPNPFRAADGASGYRATSTKKYGYFKYHIEPSTTGHNGYVAGASGYYVSNELIQKGGNTVELTQEEKQKYEAAKAMYAKSVAEFNQNGTSAYEQTPVYDKTPLVAGKIYENKLKGAVDYLNAIRVAAGLPTVKYNATLSDSAQHKAVLTVYTNNYTNLKVPNPHYPPKADEVSQEFYDTAMSHMSSENLYSGDIISGITNAINDAYGDPITCGHRYNLLMPYWTDFGLGEAAGQSAHKLSGSQSYTNSVVAWPSEGITPMEAYSGGYWTCEIFNNYQITDNTWMEVVRLNDNKKWEFKEKTTVGNHRFAINGGIISFYDGDMTGKEGDVYKFTVHNLKKIATGETTDYTYRSAFKSIYGTDKEINIKYPETISLDKKNITIGIGQTINLKTTFGGENITEISVKFSSSSNNIASVDQYGTVTALKEGTATITATTLNGKKATCTVNVTKGILGDVNNDGKVNARDAKLVLQYFNGQVTLTAEQQSRADINGDGKINARDAKLILQIFNGK